MRVSYSDGDAIVGENEGGVDAGELGVGHVGFVFSQVVAKCGFNSGENKRLGQGKIGKGRAKESKHYVTKCCQIDINRNSYN